MWLRRVQVIVTNASDSSKTMTFENHAIDFEVRSTLGTGADTATITILNLSVPEIKFLQDKNHKDLLIELRAGYSDELSGGINNADGTGVNANNIQINGGTLPTLFSGVITNTAGYKSPPEHYTNIFCMSKAGENFSKFVQMNSVKPNSTLGQAISSMCSDYGFHTISTYGIPDSVLSTVLKDGRTFHDTFLKEFSSLLSEYNLDYYVSTAEIQIFPETYGDKNSVDRMAKIRVPIQIDANRVIGNPQAGMATLSFDMFLRPDIQPGMIVDVSGLITEDILANGVVAVTNENQVLNYSDAVLRYTMSTLYQIVSIVHFGGTHRPQFISSLSCLLAGRNQMGGLEDRWPEWYSKSGMSMIEGNSYG